MGNSIASTELVLDQGGNVMAKTIVVTTATSKIVVQKNFSELYPQIRNLYIILP